MKLRDILQRRDELRKAVSDANNELGDLLMIESATYKEKIAARDSVMQAKKKLETFEQIEWEMKA